MGVSRSLFVTSKRKGRWIFPKGNRKKNESDNKASRREAFEEAGVKGRVFADFPITTVIGKASKPASAKAAVTYYPLLVSTQYDKFPESKKTRTPLDFAGKCRKHYRA